MLLASCNPSHPMTGPVAYSISQMACCCYRLCCRSASHATSKKALKELKHRLASSRAAKQSTAGRGNRHRRPVQDYKLPANIARALIAKIDRLTGLLLQAGEQVNQSSLNIDGRLLRQPRGQAQYGGIADSAASASEQHGLQTLPGWVVQDMHVLPPVSLLAAQPAWGSWDWGSDCQS